VTFEEILDQSLAMLQRRGRVTYRTLQRQFNLDDAALEDLNEALLYAHPHVADDPGHGLRWQGETMSTPPPVSSAPQPAPRPAAEDLHTCRNILDMRGHHCDGMELIVITPSWEGVVMQQPTRFKKGDKVLVKETAEEGVIEKVRTGAGDADKYYLDEEYVVRVKSGRWYIRGPLEFEPFDS
jgi:hypothetical protein